MAGGHSSSGEAEFISHPNTRTLHRGTRDDGAECGQQNDSWAVVDAKDPLDAVMYYGTPPCSKCFRHAAGLRRVILKTHRPVVIHADLSDIVNRLPWSLDEDSKKRGGCGGD